MKPLTILNRLICSYASFTLVALLCGWNCPAADIPRIGKIELYGLRTVTEREVRAKLHLKPGNPIPMEFKTSHVVSDDEIRKRLGLSGDAPLPQDSNRIEKDLATIPNVGRARLTSICCEPDGTTTVFIGIEEVGTPTFAYRETPVEPVFLPDEMIQTFDSFTDTIIEGVKSGNVKENHSEGHALFSGEVFRPLQEKFLTFARRDSSLLKKVLAGSKDAKHRAVAATILGYAPDKGIVVPDLMRAARDPDESVRNNSMRGLGAMASFVVQRPELNIRIGPDIFVEMLNSLSWSDRNKATMILLELTKSSVEARVKLRDKGMLALIEMARWSDTHSLMALQLIGRISAKDDAEVEKAWKTGQREAIIEEALKR